MAWYDCFMKMTPQALLVLQRQVDDAVITSANHLEERWQSDKQVEYKDGPDPVTESDARIEDDLRVKLHALLPDAGFIVEEGETHVAQGCNWVIDPIDQTKNFVGQIPLFYVQVALLEGAIPILGVIYNPVTHQLFSASRGNGTRLNGREVSLSARRALNEAIVDVDFGDDSALSWKIQSIERLAKAVFRLRITGAAYAPYLLTGGVSAFVVINEKTKLVDQLPRMIVMREAGFVFEERNIGGHKVVVAAHQALAAELFEVLQS